MTDQELPNQDTHVGGAIESITRIDRDLRTMDGREMTPDKLDSMEEGLDDIETVLSIRDEHPELQDAIQVLVDFQWDLILFLRKLLEAQEQFKQGQLAARDIQLEVGDTDPEAIKMFEISLQNIQRAIDLLDNLLEEIDPLENTFDGCEDAFDTLHISPPDSISAYTENDPSDLLDLQNIQQFHYFRNEAFYNLFQGKKAFEDGDTSASISHLSDAVESFEKSRTEIEEIRNRGTKSEHDSGLETQIEWIEDYLEEIRSLRETAQGVRDEEPGSSRDAFNEHIEAIREIGEQHAEQ